MGFEHPSLPVWRCAAQHFVYRLYIQPLTGYLEFSGLDIVGISGLLGYGHLVWIWVLGFGLFGLLTPNSVVG